MANAKSNTHSDILRYALTHLEQEREQIQEKIDHIKGQLGEKVSAAPAAAAGAGDAAPRKKRVLSASARKRIAAAQKKRWAEHRKAKSAKAA